MSEGLVLYTNESQRSVRARNGLLSGGKDAQGEADERRVKLFLVGPQVAGRRSNAFDPKRQLQTALEKAGGAAVLVRTCDCARPGTQRARRGTDLDDSWRAA
jgi:hypothetical protein